MLGSVSYFQIVSNFRSSNSKVRDVELESSAQQVAAGRSRCKLREAGQDDDVVAGTSGRVKIWAVDVPPSQRTLKPAVSFQLFHLGATMQTSLE